MIDGRLSSSAILLPKFAIQLSAIRSREPVIRVLLPKLFGLIWQRGRKVPRGVPVDVHIGKVLELAGFEFEPGRFYFHVYRKELGTKASKVLSIHCGRSIDKTRSQGLYWDGNCAVLSWRRGSWEDRIMAEEAESRTLLQLDRHGLVPPPSPKI